MSIWKATKPFALISISVIFGICGTLLVQKYLLTNNALPNLSSKRIPELKLTLDPAHINSTCGEVFVWKSTIAPLQNHQTGLPLHRHNYARFLIPLTEGTLQRRDASGKKTDYQLQIGQALFLPEDDAQGFHTDENLGDTPIEVVVVQFNKKPPVKVEPLTEADLTTGLVSQ